jgi:hypothetical protein
MWFIYRITYSSIKNNEIMWLAGKWIELEIITLEEINQTDKRQTLHVFSSMWNLDLKNDVSIKQGK